MLTNKVEKVNTMWKRKRNNRKTKKNYKTNNGEQKENERRK